ncbi:hypothetical protein ACFOW3_14065, partial [Acidovorax facilis]
LVVIVFADKQALACGGLSVYTKFCTPSFTPHDTRSTAKSHMKAMGVSNEVSERALNHVLKGMEEIYDQYDYLPERQAALELWAAFLVACEQGLPWTVVPLRRVA